MKSFLVLIMASVLFASGMPPAESRAAEEYVLSLNLPIPPIHNRWHFALKQWTEELNKRSNGRIRVEQMCIRDSATIYHVGLEREIGTLNPVKLALPIILPALIKLCLLYTSRCV